MKIIIQITIIFSICWVSQIVEALIPIAFPASVIGMVLLLILLLTRVLRVDHIREKSDFLLSNMAFFFIPAGVGIMEYAEELLPFLLPLLLICLITTILTFAASALTATLVIHIQQKHSKTGKEDA